MVLTSRTPIRRLGKRVGGNPREFESRILRCAAQRGRAWTLRRLTLYLVKDVADVPERNGARRRIVRPQTAGPRQYRSTCSQNAGAEVFKATPEPPSWR